MHFRRKIERPSLCTPVIDRPALYTKLNSWRTHRAVFVHAPAGYGKTTLALRWLQLSDAPHVWVSLDAAECDSVEFMRTLAAAANAPGARDNVNSQTPPHALEMLYALLEHFSTLEETLFVLDDVQRLAASDSAPLLKLLFERAPQHIHFLVLSRHNVEPALVRIMSIGAMLEISVDDLRFDADATTQLFAARRHAHSHDVVARALAATEGWPAALHMLTTLGADGWIAQYFAAEVLDPLDSHTPAMRDFLRRISVLDEFDAASCAAVTELAQAYALLSQAFVSGIFLQPLPGAAMRMHPLLRAHLLAELRAHHSQSEINRLHRNAARHLDAAGDAFAAVRHLLAADLDAAVAFVERQARAALLRGDVDLAHRLLDAIPAQTAAQHPRLLLEKCAARMLADDMTLLDAAQFATDALAQLGLSSAERARCDVAIAMYRCAGLLLHDRVDDAGASLPADPQANDALDDFGQCLFAYLKTHIARLHSQQTQTMHFGTESLRRARRIGFDALYVKVMREQARMVMNAGRSADAQAIFAEGLRWLEQGGAAIDADRFSFTLYAAENAYLQSDLERAGHLQERCLAIADRMRSAAMQNIAHCLGLKITLARTGRTPALEQLIAQAIVPNAATEWTLPSIVRIRMLLCAGCVDDAWRQAFTLGIDAQTTPATHLLTKICTYVHVYIARGVDLDAVTPLLSKSIAVAQSSGDRLSLLHLTLAIARRFQRMQKQTKTIEQIQAALDLISETGCVQMLLDIPELVPIALRFTHPVIDLIAARAGRQQRLIVLNSLTAQEHRCMDLLLENHTYADIARIEFISINTVRSHVRNLYRKLGIKEREQMRALYG